MRTLPLLARCAVAIALTVSAGLASAQAPYPNKPIRFLVPYAAGGVGDLTARIVSQKMSESMGQPIVIDNRPGAGSIVAGNLVAMADPDGYTLLLIGNNSSISTLLFKTMPYDFINDFAYVSTFAFFDLALVVAKESPFNSVKDLLTYARENPGKLNVGTISVGSTQQLASELFKSTANIQMQTVPYKATADVISALRAKDVQAGVEILAPLMGQISAGTVKVLGVASTKRSSALPNSPTIDSTLPGFEASSWNGMAAPARTPPAVIARLNKEIEKALADPEVRQKLIALGVEPKAGTPEQTKAQVDADLVKWRAVIKRANIAQQ